MLVGIVMGTEKGKGQRLGGSEGPVLAHVTSPNEIFFGGNTPKTRDVSEVNSFTTPQDRGLARPFSTPTAAMQQN